METFRAHTVQFAKQVVLGHGEKIALAAALLVMFVVLGTTRWTSRFDGTPETLMDSASRVEQGLRANAWPAVVRREFAAPRTIDAATAVRQAVDLAGYSYGVPFTSKLYAKRRPAEEPQVVSVSEMRATSGRFPLAVYRASKPAAERAAETSSGDGGKPHVKTMPSAQIHSVKVAGRPVLPGDMASAENLMSATEILDSRGVRFVCVVGVVDVRRQLDCLHRALHLETSALAHLLLEYVSFRIQRQRGVHGPDPWTGEWNDLGIQGSLELLTTEAAQWDDELVDGMYVSGVLTSPLPQRLDGGWAADVVGHPAVPLLSDDKAPSATTALPATGGKRRSDERKSVRIKRGFAGLERRFAMGSGMTATIENSPTHGMPRFPGLSQNGRPSAGSEQAGSTPNVWPELQLFRFFDFEVEPEQCYRYRVQLEIINPNFDAKRVASPDVAQGETRLSPWSQPTPPVVIERDADYFLSRIGRRGTARDEAEIVMYQWLVGAGSTIHAALKAKPGQFVGGRGKGAFLEMAVPRVSDRDLVFRADEVLLDGATFALSYEARRLHDDLRLTKQQWSDLVAGGRLDRAITLNRFGEFESVPTAAGNPRLNEAQRRLESERGPFLEKIRKEEPMPF